MSNETTKNFLKVMSEFVWPDPVPVTYRLYYNADGSPRCYTMEDLSGKYITVDCETYVSQPRNVRVIDDKLHIIPPTLTISKLVPGTQSGTCCAPTDICVVVSTDQPHTKWSMKQHETN